MGLTPPLAHDVLLGRYFDILSNKHSNKKCANRNKHLTNANYRPFKALLVGSSLVNSVSLFSSFSHGQSQVARQLRLSESEANR
jgi:hypothetical protein